MGKENLTHLNAMGKGNLTHLRAMEKGNLYNSLKEGEH